MQASLIKQRLRVPYHLRQMISLGILLLVTVVTLAIQPIMPPGRLFNYWTAAMWLLMAAHTMIGVVSYLELSDRGLVMRRGWQSFAIDWDQIESFGIGSISKNQYLPYIILREPIKGLPTVKLKELLPSEYQRTLTLEGWANPEIIAKALHAGLNANSQSWQVAPDFSKSLKYFYYYQRVYIWLVLAMFMVFAYILVA